MIKRIRDFRLIPIVLIASVCLLALKLFGIIADGGYTLGAGHLAKTDRMARESARIAAAQLLRLPAITEPQSAPTQTKQSWAQEMFNYPDVTGSIGSSGPPAKDAAAGKAGDKKEGEDAKPGNSGDAKAANKPAEPKPSPGGTPIMINAKPISAAERAILERLQERRHELDQRARELDVRETLLQEKEKRVEAQLNELKETEMRINAAMQKKEEADTARFKSLVTMYENMKAKDAAKIFDRLDMRVLIEVASLINPRRMSDIMAQMSPEAAEHLTVELANRGTKDGKDLPTADLPKIEGRPSGG